MRAYNSELYVQIMNSDLSLLPTCPELNFDTVLYDLSRRDMSSIKTEEHIPRSVATATRAVLLSSVKGVPIRNFCKDYTRLLGES